MKNVILYHAACPDGAMAAAVVLQALQDRGETADLVPASYQKPLSDFVTPEKIKESEIYIVDFSFSPEETNTFAEWCHHVIVLDHHESAIQKYEKAFDCSRANDGKMIIHYRNVKIHFDLNHSGAALAWQFFHHDPPPPPALISHVEDYDLWRHTLPDSRAVHAFLRSYNMDVHTYVDLLRASTDMTIWNRFLVVGHAILRANEQQARVLASHPEIVTFDGLTALAVNAPLHQDDVGEQLAKKCESGVGILWYWREEKYKVSLRSCSVENRVPFNCSALAMKYGGGGHIGAASFLCDKLPWKK